MSDLTTRLETALLKSSKARTGANSTDPRGTFVPLLIQLHEHIDKADWNAASQTLTQIENFDQTMDVLQIARELSDQIRMQAGAREDALVRGIEAGVRKAGEACLAAQQQKDLDPILTQLTLLRPASDRFESEPMRRAYSKLDVALNFVARWQDYLAKRSLGKEVEAAAIIQKLADNNNVYLVVPRSELLARTEVTSRPNTAPKGTTLKEIVASAKSLEDLESLYMGLQQLDKQESRDPQNQLLLDQVRSLRQAWLQMKAGQYGPAFQAYLSSTPQSAVSTDCLAGLRQQLLLQVIPHYINASAIPTPAQGETPSDFLLRLAKEAAQKERWDEAERAMQTYRIIAFGGTPSPGWIMNSVAAYRAMAAATRQEAAEQFVEAVKSYQVALDCGGEGLAAEVVAKHLTRLKKEHPEAYSEAMKHLRSVARHEPQS
jgi:hypothetical protein